MIARKCTAAYFTSWTMVIWLSFPFMAGAGASWHAARDYMSWASMIALYALPGAFLYGILVSSLIDWAIGKLRRSGPGEWVLSGLLHVFMGFLFGWIVQSSLFSMMGGTAAVLFFVYDRLARVFLPRLRQKVRLILLASPVLVFVLIIGALYLTSPHKPPFTAEDAVRFATSGTGSAMDDFPKLAGITKLQVEGYDVERETRVDTVAKEKYLVYFIERWRKGENSGEHRMIYEVTRGSMGAKGGGGETPPYRRPSGAYRP